MSTNPRTPPNKDTVAEVAAELFHEAAPSLDAAGRDKFVKDLAGVAYRFGRMSGLEDGARTEAAKARAAEATRPPAPKPKVFVDGAGYVIGFEPGIEISREPMSAQARRFYPSFGFLDMYKTTVPVGLMPHMLSFEFGAAPAVGRPEGPAAKHGKFADIGKLQPTPSEERIAAQAATKAVPPKCRICGGPHETDPKAEAELIAALACRASGSW